MATEQMTQRIINRAVLRRIKGLLGRQPGSWSIYRLAAEAGISNQTLYCIMREKQKTISIYQIKEVCDAFGITVTEFFDAPEFHCLPCE